MARRLACTCPREGPLAVEEGWHDIRCPARRAGWSRGERMRYWLIGRIPFSGVTPYEGDDAQRPKTPAENYVEATGTSAPIEVFEKDEYKPRYQRLQERVRNDAYGLATFGRPPTWRHLGERLLTLVVEGTVRLRRYLVWLAPFIVAAYIALDVVRGG